MRRALLVAIIGAIVIAGAVIATVGLALGAGQLAWRRIWPHNRKRPAFRRGAIWGYYREERYVSLYMWIDGR